MNPASYSWIPDRDSGVSHKWLGTFTERETRVGFVRIEKGASFEAGMQDRTELLFLAKGAIICRDRAFPAHSAFSFDQGDGPVRLTATDDAELLRILVPKF
jgi:hypothetical protein